MATTSPNPSNLSTSDHSSGFSIASPQSRRSATRTAPFPWTQIVRGESESLVITSSDPSTAPSDHPTAGPTMEQTAAVAAVAAVDASTSSMAAEEYSSENDNGSGNAGRSSVWNIPSNGVVVESGPVMGADTWPDLCEAARVSTKSSSDSLKGLSSEVSAAVVTPQASGAGVASSQKQVNNNENSDVTAPNATMPRQRSMKQRNGGANASSNGGMIQPPASQASQVGEMHLSSSSSTGEHGGQRSSQGRSGNDHSQQQQHRNSFRSRQGGSHSRGGGGGGGGGGDGSHHQNYVGRRDHDRGTQDWNHRNFRDGHMQQQRVVQRFMRHPPPPPPPPTTTPFGAPPPVRPFGAPMGFSELGAPVYYVPAPHPESLRGVPFVAAPMPPHAVFFPTPDLHLPSKIVNQIDYYFSNENLVKDTFLRRNMDEQGWVSIKLIAGFKKVSNLTDNIQLIMEAIKNSTIVELQDDKVRRRNDWMRWIMPTAVQFPNTLGLQSPGKSSPEALVAHVHNISLEEKTGSHGNISSQTGSFLGRSGDLVGVGEGSVTGAADRSASRN